jgi:hypothetical protein
MNNDDYGYFGKGTEGYIHYKQTFDECFKDTTPVRRGTIQSKLTVPKTKEEWKSSREFFRGFVAVCGVICGSTIFVLLVWLIAAITQ